MADSGHSSMGSRPPPAPAGRIVPRSSIARYRRGDLETIPNSPGSGCDRNSSARAALTQQARLRRHCGSRGRPRRPLGCIAGDEVEANGHPIPHDRWAPGASRLTPRPAGRPPPFRACSRDLSTHQARPSCALPPAVFHLDALNVNLTPRSARPRSDQLARPRGSARSCWQRWLPRKPRGEGSVVGYASPAGGTRVVACRFPLVNR